MNDVNLTGFQIKLLCFIVEKYEPDIAALQEEYERWHNSQIGYQSVYMAMERLDDLGYVEKKAIDGRANCYMLTTTGAEILNKHRELVLGHTRQIKEALN